MEPIEQLDTLIPIFCELAEQVGPGDLDRATPCEQWQVRDLLNHIGGGAPVFAALFRGEDARPFPDEDQLGDDPGGAVRRALEEFDAAVRTPGALERTVQSPFGAMPGDTFARLAAFDLSMHCWDLARALGSELALDEQLVDEIDAFARAALTPELRGPGTFGPERQAPPDAPPLDHLAAFAGRAP